MQASGIEGDCRVNLSRAKRAPGGVRPGDIVLVVLFAALAVISLVLVSRASAGEKGSIAVIEVNGKSVMRIALGKNQSSRRFEVRGVSGISTVEVKDGRVRMVESACRDKLCVGVGWIDSRGREIVCLPNRVVLRVTGRRGGGEVDSVTE